MTTAAIAALALKTAELLNKLILERRDPTPAEWEILKSNIADAEKRWADQAPKGN